jgi:hypothetical protein
MTRRANSLTERVTKRPGNAQSASWSLPANELRVLIDGLTRLGYNRDALFVTAALHEVDLDDPDARVPCEAIGARVSRAQQERFTPNLGLEGYISQSTLAIGEVAYQRHSRMSSDVFPQI